MVLNNAKQFKGFLQYKSTDNFTKVAGYIYFVRVFNEKNEDTGNTEIYFGTRKYGEVATTQIAALQTSIKKNAGDIEAIQKTIGEWTNATSTLANAIISVSGTSETNKTDIATLKGTGDGSVTKAVNEAINTATGYTSTQINEVKGLINNKNVSAKGDDYVTATTTGNTVIVSATTGLTSAIEKANSALQAADIKEGDSSGTISVDGTDVAVKGLGSAAYTNSSAYDVSGAADNALKSATGYTNDEIAKLSGTITGESSDKFVKVEVVETAGKITSVTVTTNDIAKNSDLTTHTGNGDIHVTVGDKNKWDDAVTRFNTFISGDTETALDTLVELQQYIISDSGATKTMLANISSAQTTANKAVSDIETISGKVNTNITNIASISGAVANNTTAITANANAIVTVDGKITGLTEDFNTYTSNTNNVLESIENRLTGITNITNNAVTGVTSTGNTINVGKVNGVVNVEVNTLDVETAQEKGYIAIKNDNGALYGVMYYGGDDAE